MELATVPTIDLTDWWEGDDAARRAVATEVATVCREVGFFKIANHGVDPALIARMEAVTSEFFSLPVEEKTRYLSPAAEVNRGYAEKGSEALSYSVGLESPPDLFEAFNVGVQNHTIDPSTLPANHAILYHENIWPDAPTDMKSVWQEYLVAMFDLAQEMLRVFATALDLDPEYFASRAVQSPDVFRALNYVREQGAPDPLPGQMRLGAHSDYGMCTILLADPVPGLQILTAENTWRDIVPTEGTFLVNIGDMMAAWTNDHWRSTVHRVVPPDASMGRAQRRSYAFFHEAETSAVIEPLASCIDDDHPVRYETMSAGDHLYGKIVSPRSMKKTASALTTADRSEAIKS